MKLVIIFSIYIIGLNPISIKAQMKKALWRNYYIQEKIMLNTLRDSCKILHEGNFPYNLEELDTFSKPPRYIRAILQAENQKKFTECIAAIDSFKSTFVAAKADAPIKNLPRNLAVIIENVEQINIFINDAYISRKLKKNTPLVIYSERYIIGCEPRGIKIASLLRERGIKITIIEDSSFFGIEVNTSDLFEYFQTSDIQARRKSGSQHRVLIRKHNESKGFRDKLGLILLSPNNQQEVAIYDSIKQAKRPHSLENSKRELKFDFDFDFDWKLYKTV